MEKYQFQAKIDFLQMWLASMLSKRYLFISASIMVIASSVPLYYISALLNYHNYNISHLLAWANFTMITEMLLVGFFLLIHLARAFVQASIHFPESNISFIFQEYGVAIGSSPNNDIVHIRWLEFKQVTQTSRAFLFIRKDRTFYVLPTEHFSVQQLEKLEQICQSFLTPQQWKPKI
jgi:hypothetical protein